MLSAKVAKEQAEQNKVERYNSLLNRTRKHVGDMINNSIEDGMCWAHTYYVWNKLELKGLNEAKNILSEVIQELKNEGYKVTHNIECDGTELSITW